MGVTKNDRLVNFVIDTVAISIVLFIAGQIPSRLTYSYFFPVLISFSYYFILELAFKRTLGKLVTRTKVVSAKNKRPHTLHIFMRSLLRLASPFDMYSYLLGGEQGIHDVLSRTKLVKIDKDK